MLFLLTKISTFLAQEPAQYPGDGLWIDMNEPSNFCDGACKSAKSQQQDGPKVNLIKPPYAIHNQGQRRLPLNSGNLDMDTVHHGDVPHYDMHNLYGTYSASMDILNSFLKDWTSTL
jgi:alpha-glucosidase (family GH31 glycosyl hydrolase)